MGWILTKDGPFWEHIPGQWYQGAGGFLLCDKCAESWSTDNADFEFDGYAEGYRQTGGFLEPAEAGGTDSCLQCERPAAAVAPGHRALPILLLLVMLTQQACAHSSSYMVTTTDSQVVRCENTDFSIGSRWPLGVSIYTGDICMILRTDKAGHATWQRIIGP